MARLEEQLHRLPSLSPAELQEEWRHLHRQEPPCLSPDLLRHSLAHAAQEQVLGKLPARVARSLENGTTVAAPPAKRLSPGTQLVRSWNGRSIEVTVLDEGFRFEDRSYRSLSAIAREVTGTSWSGPRFFGVANG